MRSASATAPAKSCLGESIANPPISVDAPGLLRIIVKQSVRPHLRNERLAVGLNIVLFVGGAADDFGRLSVPHPVHLEARLRLRQHGKFNWACFQVLPS